LFLLSIIVLPVTTGLLGSYIASADVTALYGFNLTLISTLTTILWVIAAEPRRDWVAMVAPAFPTVVFVVASILGLFAPHLARFVWPIAFAAPILAAYVERREDRQMEG